MIIWRLGELLEGVAALYRVLALLSLQGGALEGHELALRYQHLATVWVTHVWETFARREEGGGPGEGWAWYDKGYIDGSAWPIHLQELNLEMHTVQQILAQRPLVAGKERPSVKLSIGIASVCAFGA